MSSERLLLNYNQHFINLEISFFLQYFQIICFLKLSLKFSTIFIKNKQKTILPLGKTLFDNSLIVTYLLSIQSLLRKMADKWKMIPNHTAQQGSVQTTGLIVLIHRKAYLSYNKISFQTVCLLLFCFHTVQFILSNDGNPLERYFLGASALFSKGKCHGILHKYLLFTR